MNKTPSPRWFAERRVWLIGGVMLLTGIIAAFLCVSFLQIRTVSIPFASSVLLRNVLTNEMIVVSEDGVARRVIAEGSEKTLSTSAGADLIMSVIGAKFHQGTRLHLSHTWIDGELLFHFSVTQITPQMLEVLAQGSTDHRYGLYFMTVTGEVLLERAVPLTEMVRARDDNGAPVSLSFYGRERMSRRAYESLSDWSFSWNWGSPTTDSSDTPDRSRP